MSECQTRLRTFGRIAEPERRGSARRACVPNCAIYRSRRRARRAARLGVARWLNRPKRRIVSTRRLLEVKCVEETISYHIEIIELRTWRNR